MQALLHFVAVASDAAPSVGAGSPRMAAMVAVANNGELMKPLTTIETRDSRWFGVLAVACEFIATLFTLAQHPTAQRRSCAQREVVRRSMFTLAR